MTALIEADALSRVYDLGAGTVHALDAVDLSIDRGEFVAIMGPSGSGKSTCMHLLGCLDRPTAGRYLLDGIDVSSLRPDGLATIRNEKIGFVFQSFNLLGRQTALENVEMPLLYGGLGRRERRDRAVAALEAVGLAERMDHRPNQLSGGQQQRVAVARAIVNEPAMILADEPTGALDSRTGLEIVALLQSLNQRGITVVVVTHDAELARFAGRVLHFRDGHLVADERVAEPLSAARLLAPEPAGAEPAVAASLPEEAPAVQSSSETGAAPHPSTSDPSVDGPDGEVIELAPLTAPVGPPRRHRPFIDGHSYPEAAE